MKMNQDEFESRLQRTPLKRPPSEWREEILVAADVNRRTSPIRELTFAATWRTRLRELFWPHPVAWGALASIWLVLGAVHLALREPGQRYRQIYVAADANVPTMMSIQRELLASLEQPANKPKTAPTQVLAPQSCIERRRKTLEA